MDGFNGVVLDCVTDWPAGTLLDLCGEYRQHLDSRFAVSGTYGLTSTRTPELSRNDLHHDTAWRGGAAGSDNCYFAPRGAAGKEGEEGAVSAMWALSLRVACNGNPAASGQLHYVRCSVPSSHRVSLRLTSSGLISLVSEMLRPPPSRCQVSSSAMSGLCGQKNVRTKGSQGGQAVEASARVLRSLLARRQAST